MPFVHYCVMMSKKNDTNMTQIVSEENERTPTEVKVLSVEEGSEPIILLQGCKKKSKDSEQFVALNV